MEQVLEWLIEQAVGEFLINYQVKTEHHPDLLIPLLTLIKFDLDECLQLPLVQLPCND